MGDINLLKPIALFEQLFETRMRLDHRLPLEHAPHHLTARVLPACHGSALARVGHTQAICGIKVKVLPNQVGAGRIVCNVQISGLASRTAHPGQSTSREAQALSAQLQRLLDTVVCPDVSDQLHIYADETRDRPIASYLLKLDVVVLHDDGCLLDACLPAALIALQSARWPRLIATQTEDEHQGSGVASSLERYKPVGPTNWVSVVVTELAIPVTCCIVPLPVVKVQQQGRKFADTNPRVPIMLQPSRRDLAMWDTDAGPVQLILSPSGRVLTVSLVNAFLPGLFSGLIPTDNDSEETETSIFNALYEACKSYANEIHIAIVNATATK